MKNNPKISIITVVYNGEQFLEETILSVLNQSYENIEYIIIDGGSSDGTLNIIKKYEDKIDYWVSEPDKGIYDAMNKGIDIATGEWVNFMNAGDKILFLDSRDFFTKKSTYTNYFYDYEKFGVFRKPLSKTYLTRNTPCHQSIIYKRSELIKYDINIPIIADYNQMLEISSMNTYTQSFGSSIVFYNEAGVSSMQNYSKKDRYKHLIQRSKLVKKYLGMPYYILTLLHMLRILLK